MTLTRSYTDSLERALARVIADARREMATAFAEYRATVAEYQAQLATAKAEVSDLKAALAEHVDAMVARAIEALPKPEPMDPSGFVTEEQLLHGQKTVTIILEGIHHRIDALQERPAPEPVDLTPFVTKDELLEASLTLRSAMPQPVEMPDLSGFATREDVDALRREIPEVPEPKDWAPEIQRAFDAAQIVADGLDSVRGEVHERMDRLAERPGVFPVVRSWTDDGVTYAGHVVTHDGALWQARRDTGKAPGHDDWVCIVRAGQDGADGRSPNPTGLYDAAHKYERLDVVALDGNSFVAVQDDPGPCPGDGWRVLAQRGKPGRPGDPGKGIKGDKGDPGTEVVAFYIDAEKDAAVIVLSNGTTHEASLYDWGLKVAQ